jgi:hypothetical protein
VPYHTLHCWVRDQRRAQRKTVIKAPPNAIVDAQSPVRELEAEVCKLTLERDIPKIGGVLRAGAVVKYALIRDELVGTCTTRIAYRLLEVSPCDYHRLLTSLPAPREQRRRAIARSWYASMQNRAESTVHRRSRANFRNLVSPRIGTRFRESCKITESVQNNCGSTVQNLFIIRTRMRVRQIFLSVTSMQRDQTRSGCATSLTFHLTRASSSSRA